MNALHLAICGNHTDIVRILVDEHNVPLVIRSPVSIQLQILNDVIDTVLYLYMQEEQEDHKRVSSVVYT